MIWDWINAIAVFIKKLFMFPAIPPQMPRRIDANAPCPFCGNCDGILLAVERDQKMLVQHQCKFCRGKWWEDPILKEYESTAATGASIKIEAPALPPPPKE
jgi:hypothetical protein